MFVTNAGLMLVLLNSMGQSELHDTLTIAEIDSVRAVCSGLRAPRTRQEATLSHFHIHLLKEV